MVKIKIEMFLIGFCIFSAFILMGVFIIKDINTSYEGIIDEKISTADFNESFNSVDKMYNISQDQKEVVMGGELTAGSITESSFGGTMTAVRMVSGTFSLVGAIINDVSKTIGIPTFLIKIALTIISISIIFGVISIILRFK